MWAASCSVLEPAAARLEARRPAELLRMRCAHCHPLHPRSMPLPHTLDMGTGCKPLPFPDAHFLPSSPSYFPALRK